MFNLFTKSKKKKHEKPKFCQLIEAIIKEDSVKKEEFMPKLDSKSASSVCHEMVNLKILSLSHKDVDNIINNFESSYTCITDDTIQNKENQIAELILNSIILRPKSWGIHRNNINSKKMTVFFKKNDSIYIEYFIFNSYSYSLYYNVYDEYYLVNDNVVIKNHAIKYLKSLYLEPKFKTLTLADKFIRGN